MEWKIKRTTVIDWSAIDKAKRVIPEERDEISKAIEKKCLEKFRVSCRKYKSLILIFESCVSYIKIIYLIL